MAGRNAHHRRIGMVRRNLNRAGRRVDYILTHDAPLQILEFTQYMRGQPNWLHTFSTT